MVRQKAAVCSLWIFNAVQFPIMTVRPLCQDFVFNEIAEHGEPCVSEKRHVFAIFKFF